MNTNQVCPSCGRPLAPDVPAGLCPQCLLQSKLPTISGEGSGLPAGAAQAVPVPGQDFGGYRIARLLGQGGMGVVYEAEQAETGRRVALKVMRQTLGSEQDRKRFLREGRLAASVNHSNVVYIHGSEEIQGVPVIAMELVHGGTLKDRLKREKRLPVAEAIEAVLQMISGLEAAHAAGVLHRDIKPGNCFVTADGTVKVGDFGLSVSTLARGESLLTASGSVIGTPAYASPEQLRGEELDVRSDVYSVGATLHHLLAGQTPFQSADMVKLITEVLDKPPPALTTLCSEIPAELSGVVLRCLAKDRNDRFQTYGALRDALLPFRAAESVPAKPAMRFLADVMDSLIGFAPTLIYGLYWNAEALDQVVQDRTWSALWIWLPLFLWQWLYYGVAEGLWGAALGKSVCGLRVVGADRQAPGIPRALLRSGIFLAPWILPSACVMALLAVGATDQNAFPIRDAADLALFLLLFVTMRARNGYAALQDLGSGTRVIVCPKTQPRPILAELSWKIAAEKQRVAAGTFGPYEVRGRLWKRAEEELLAGFDPVLRRAIWIHTRPAGTEPTARLRRELSRPGRLRWLNGGAAQDRSWNAYEAMDGAPLKQCAAQGAPWRAVRFWLLDLAQELAAGLKAPEAAVPVSMDHVWISQTGHAMLLEFPGPGLPEDASTSPAVPIESIESLQSFITEVARTALGAELTNSARAKSEAFNARVPLHAAGFLTTLARRGFDQVEFLLGNLHSLAARDADITPARRAASVLLVPAAVIMLGLIIGIAASSERIRWEHEWAALYPGKPSLRAAAQEYTIEVDLRREGHATDRDVELARAYLVAHFGTMLTNDAFWTQPLVVREFGESERTLLRMAVTAHQPPRSEDVEEATRIMASHAGLAASATGAMFIWLFLGQILAGSLLVALVELLGCVLFRQSPVLRLFGMAIVDRAGAPATRGRLAWRWALVWGPVGAMILMAAGAGLASTAFPVWSGAGDLSADRPGPFVWLIPASVASILVLNLIYTARHPECGLADRFAGTWLVSR